MVCTDRRKIWSGARDRNPTQNEKRGTRKISGTWNPQCNSGVLQRESSCTDRQHADRTNQPSTPTSRPHFKRYSAKPSLITLTHTAPPSLAHIQRCSVKPGLAKLIQTAPTNHTHLKLVNNPGLRELISWLVNQIRDGHVDIRKRALKRSTNKTMNKA